MKPFDQFTYDDAAGLLKATVPVAGTRFFPLTNSRRPPTAIAATLFYSGDHWQNAKGFIGQLPPPSLPGASLILQDIRDGFVSENVVQEVVETHTGGILGREPVWSFLPADPTKDTAAIKTDKSSFENVTGETLTPWWNERKALRDLQKAVTTLLCEGISIRRLFFPRGRIVDGRVTAKDLAGALDFIYFETLTADVAGVFTDPDTQKDIGIFLFQEKKPDGEVIANCAELSFLDNSKRTVCKVVKDKGEPETFGPYELGGRLLIYQLDRRALITDQVQSNQRAINLAHTMMMRNVNMAGARERTVTNAQPPVNVVGVDVLSKKPATEPGTYKTGAGAVMFLMGFPIRDEAGNIVGYTNPNVSVSDPVSVETFVATSDHYREAIYSQCHQRHVLIVDKADTSGRAREVARREFERSLKESKTVVDASGRWQLETALRLAAQVSNQVSRYAGLRADFNCLIDAGEPDPEKQKTAILLRAPGGAKNEPLISDETARNWIGVEDAAAEKAKIRQEAKDAPAELPPPAVAPPVAGTDTTIANNTVN
jgi:hypothetical protein